MEFRRFHRAEKLPKKSETQRSTRPTQSQNSEHTPTLSLRITGVLQQSTAAYRKNRPATER